MRIEELSKREISTLAIYAQCRRARICEDLKEKWIEYSIAEEGFSRKDVLKHYNKNGDLDKFHEKYAGKSVFVADHLDDIFILSDNDYPITEDMIEFLEN